MPRTASNRAPRLAWSMSSDSRADALDAYRQSMSDFYGVSDVDTGGQAFHNSTTIHLFGGHMVCRGRSNTQTLTRSAQEIRRSDLDHIYVIINFAETRSDCDGRSVQAEPGSVQFRDLSRPSASRTTVDTVNAMVPRAMVPAWLRDNRLHGLHLPASSPGGRLVASHLTTLIEVAAEITEEEGAAALEATFVIAERFMGKAGTVAPAHSDAIHRTIRRRAMALIDASDIGGRIDIDTLARRIGVSRTSLYRAFDTMGGVKAYAMERRLSRAHAALRARTGPEPSVDAIAERFGFTSRAAFASAFRTRFGVAPGDIPPAMPLSGRRGAGVSGGVVIDEALHPVALDWIRANAVI